LYFSPGSDPAGTPLTVTVTYADGKVARTSLVAGHADPHLAAASPPPAAVTWDTFHARWVGQDGFTLLGPGDVHLTLDGLPAGRSVVEATLSDQVGLDWTYLKPGPGVTPPDPTAGPPGFPPDTDPPRAYPALPPLPPPARRDGLPPRAHARPRQPHHPGHPPRGRPRPPRPPRPRAGGYARRRAPRRRPQRPGQRLRHRPARRRPLPAPP